MKKFADSNDLTWYICGGAGYFFNDWGGTSGDIDIRLPVGIDWNFHKKWDAYLQGIPALRIGDSTGFEFGGAIGVRYKF